MLNTFQYVQNADKIIEDVREFGDAENEIIPKMKLPDLIHMACAMKEFNNNIKPLITKYGIIPHLNDGGLS